MSKITEQDYQEYSKLIEDGHSQRSACLILGLNRSTIQRYIKCVLEDEVSEQYLETQIDHKVNRLINTALSKSDLSREYKIKRIL